MSDLQTKAREAAERYTRGAIMPGVGGALELSGREIREAAFADGYLAGFAAAIEHGPRWVKNEEEWPLREVGWVCLASKWRGPDSYYLMLNRDKFSEIPLPPAEPTK
jgi:hypothetical protein